MGEEKELREVVVDFRAKYNLSMKQMSELVGVTIQTIYNLENGLAKPTRLTEAKIRRAIKLKEEE